MKRLVLFGILLALCSLSAEYTQIFSQPYITTGAANTSTLAPASGVDYEVADNFSGLTAPITKLSFWGVTATFDGGWVQGPPAAIEPFKIRFYELEQDWTQPPVGDPGIMAPSTGTYTINLYDSFGDGWNGGLLDAYVNGVLVQAGMTVSDGAGPATYTFQANAGEYILTDYTAGGWGYENWYEILNPDLSVLAQDGDDTQSAPPTGIGVLAIPPLFAPSTGMYSITLYDDYGDGWNGGVVDVYVNGFQVLDNLSIASGFGPETHNFSANAGEEIVTIYTAGGWGYENWYQILDPANNVIAQDGDDTQTITPQGIGFLPTLVTLEPDWANPLYSFDVNATSTYIEDWDTWTIYKYEAVLPAGVNLAEGWVSAQIDAANGSGLWFLWMQGTGGDSQSFQRVGSKNSGPQAFATIIKKPAPDSDDKAVDVVSSDMGFELYTGTATEIVISDPGVTLPAGVTVTDGGTLPPVLEGPDAGEPVVLYTIDATGIWDVRVYKPLGWVGDWNCWIQAGATLYPAANPVLAEIAFWTFTGIDFGVKAPATVIINDNQTLPVELSSFTAILTSDLLVKIAWVVQSETNHLGYNIMRGMEAGISNAIQINSSLINEGEALGTQISYSYADSEVDVGSTYFYWLESVDLGGTSYFYGPISVLVTGTPDDPGTPELPTATKLMNAFPNPFNPNTTLRYALKEAGQVRVDIYNLKGQMIRSFERDHSSPGYYQISWDGKDIQGLPVSSGVYMYRMVSGRYHSIKKMVLAK